MSYRGAIGQAQLWADERAGSPPFINCVAASGVNLAGAATLGTVPTTDAEVNALRRATGDLSGGENLIELLRGMLNRYGWSGSLDESWQTIVNGLVSGHKAFAVLGLYSHLPPEYRRPQPAFTGGHCVYIGPNTAQTAWWVDPLDREDNGHPKGRSIPILTLRTFCASMAYASLGLTEGSHRIIHYAVSIRPLAVIRFYSLDATGCITGWHDRRWLGGSSSAPATVPVHRLTCDRTSGAMTTRITAGAFAGQHIRIGSGGVTLRTY